VWRELSVGGSFDVQAIIDIWHGRIESPEAVAAD
jgi:hypothetical protein